MTKGTGGELRDLVPAALRCGCGYVARAVDLDAARKAYADHAVYKAITGTARRCEPPRPNQPH